MKGSKGIQHRYLYHGRLLDRPRLETGRGCHSNHRQSLFTFACSCCRYLFGSCRHDIPTLQNTETVHINQNDGSIPKCPRRVPPLIPLCHVIHLLEAFQRQHVQATHLSAPWFVFYIYLKCPPPQSD